MTHGKHKISSSPVTRGIPPLDRNSWAAERRVTESCCPWGTDLHLPLERAAFTFSSAFTASPRINPRLCSEERLPPQALRGTGQSFHSHPPPTPKSAGGGVQDSQGWAPEGSSAPHLPPPLLPLQPAGETSQKQTATIQVQVRRSIFGSTNNFRSWQIHLDLTQPHL